MDIKRKKNIAFALGFITGMALGVVMHRMAMGAGLGVILGLAARELYERNLYKKR